MDKKRPRPSHAESAPRSATVAVSSSDTPTASMTAAAKRRKTDLVFQGAAMLRQRLVCSILAGKTIRIDAIRADEERPGLSEAEACVLRLIDRITNGTVIEINETGTDIFLSQSATLMSSFSLLNQNEINLSSFFFFIINRSFSQARSFGWCQAS
jgi:hypothetical protein